MGAGEGQEEEREHGAVYIHQGQTTNVRPRSGAATFQDGRYALALKSVPGAS